MKRAWASIYPSCLRRISAIFQGYEDWLLRFLKDGDGLMHGPALGCSHNVLLWDSRKEGTGSDGEGLEVRNG